LTDLIVTWNTTVTYVQSYGDLEKERTANCQQFIDVCVKTLGLEQSMENLPSLLCKL
jgi:hypothetical protein